MGSQTFFHDSRLGTFGLMSFEAMHYEILVIVSKQAGADELINERGLKGKGHLLKRCPEVADQCVAARSSPLRGSGRFPSFF
jgi:glycogen synthase